MVVDDGAEVIDDFVPFLPDGFAAYIVGILRFFSGRKVAVCGDQLPDAFFNQRPLHQNFRTVALVRGIAADLNTFPIVLLPQAAAGNYTGAAAPAIGILQKFDIFLGCLALLKEFIDAQLSIPVVIAAGDHKVNGGLGKYKARTILGMGFQDHLLLLLHSRQRSFIRGKPCVHHEHTVDSGSHTAPTVVDLPFPAQIRATPQVKHIIIGSVSHSLAVAENLFDKGIIEESLQKIAAFLVIRVGCKECGNFHSMIYQPFAGAQQLVLFIVLMEELDLPFEVAVPSA